MTALHNLKDPSGRQQVLWLTGLSGAGKTTIGTILVRKLTESGRRAYLLDADVLRAGLNSDLGFSDSDRTENIRRICEVAKLLQDAGVIAVVACISPLRSQRLACRKLIGSNGFIEVFVDTVLTECIRRDPKGLYKKALSGELKNFTGLHAPYEPPENPEFHAKTELDEADQLAADILEYLNRRASQD